MANYYEILKIGPDATSEEIRKAYQNLTLELHPDKNNNDQQSFVQIQEAYEILSNAEKRKQYDESLKQAPSSQLVFVLNDDNAPTDSNCRSLVLRKTISFATAAQLANLTRDDLIELANKDEKIADAIYASIDLSKQLASRLLEITYNHEQLACQILMNDNEKYLNTVIYHYPLITLAKKYWSVCKIILTKPILFTQLYPSDLYDLNQHYQEKFEQVACPQILELVAIDTYFTNISKNGLPPEINKSKLLYKLKKIIKDRDKVVELAKKNLLIAELIFEDQELFCHIAYLYGSIAIRFESLACQFLLRQKYILPNYLFDIAQCYWSCCIILLNNPTLYNKLTSNQLITLKTHYNSQFEKHCDIALKEIIELAEYAEKLLTAPTDFEVDVIKLNKILTSKNNNQFSMIEKICKKYRQAAEIYISIPELININSYSTIDVCFTHESLLNSVLQEQKYWPRSGFNGFSLAQAAKKYKSSCLIILSIEKHYNEISGSNLHALILQHGPQVAQIINTNPVLLKRLRATLLIMNTKAQSKPSLQHEAPHSTDTEADMFYFTGCIYRNQKTRDGYDIAKQNFYQAALLGHAMSMKELEQLVDHNDTEYCLKIIQILIDPQNTLCDMSNALHWFEKLITDKNSEMILSILQHKNLWKFLIKNRNLLLQLAKSNVNICRFILESSELNQDFSGEMLYELISLYKDDIALCIINQKYLFHKLTYAILDHLNIYGGNESNANHYTKYYVKIAHFLFENNCAILGESYLYKSACQGHKDSLTEYISYIKNMTAPTEHDSTEIQFRKMKLRILYRLILFFIYVDPHNPLHDRTIAGSLFHNFIIKHCDETMISQYLLTYLDNDFSSEITTFTRACSIIKYLSNHYLSATLFDMLGDQFLQRRSAKEAEPYYLIATLMHSAQAFNKLIKLISSDDTHWQLLILLVYNDKNNINFNRQEAEKRIAQLKPEMYFKLAETILYYLDQKHILDHDYSLHQLNYLTKFIDELTTECKSFSSADIYYHMSCIFYQNQSLTIAEALLNSAAKHGSYAAGFKMMQLINPLEKWSTEQIAHDPLILQNDNELRNLISLVNKLFIQKNAQLSIEQLTFKSRFYFYFSSLRLVIPKQTKTIQDQYLYECLYQHASNTFIIFHRNRIIIRDLKEDNSVNHQSILHQCHYLIDRLWRYYADFPLIRHKLSNELYDISNQTEIGNQPYYDKLNDIILRYEKLMQQIVILNNQRNALIKICNQLDKHIAGLSARMKLYEENNDLDSRAFYYKRINLLNGLNTLISSLLDNHYSGDLSADIHKIDSETIHQKIRDHIEILLSKESELIKHYRWTSEKFAEHFPKIYSLFGTRFENNTVQFFKEKIIPKLDRRFGIYNSNTQQNIDENSIEMREINQFDIEQPNDAGIELAPLKPPTK